MLYRGITIFLIFVLFTFALFATPGDEGRKTICWKGIHQSGIDGDESQAYLYFDGALNRYRYLVLLW